MAHASSLGVDSTSVSVGVRPLMKLASGAVRLFDTVTVRGTFKPVREGQSVTVELQHRGRVVATKRGAMDANGRFTTTFFVSQAGSYRARASLDASDLLPGRAATPPSVTCSPTWRWARTASTSTSWSAGSSNCTTTWSASTTSFDYRTADAVMAFRKVQGMARTQTVDAATWRALGTPKLFVPRHRETASISRSIRRARCSPWSVTARWRPSSTSRPGSPRRPRETGRSTSTRSSRGSARSSCTTRASSTGSGRSTGGPTSPTYAASHGCVRIPYWVTLWMFDQDPIGTPVFIYH